MAGSVIELGEQEVAVSAIERVLKLLAPPEALRLMADCVSLREAAVAALGFPWVQFLLGF